MLDLKRYVLDKVQMLEAECRKQSREPICAPLPDIKKIVDKEVKAALNQLVADEVLTWYRNINGIPIFKSADKV